jgi:hypothetical protein
MEEKKSKNLKKPKKSVRSKIVTTDREFLESIEPVSDFSENTSGFAEFTKNPTDFTNAEKVADLVNNSDTNSDTNSEYNEKHQKELRKYSATFNQKELNDFALEKLRTISICEQTITESENDNRDLREITKNAATKEKVVNTKSEEFLAEEDFEEYEDKDFSEDVENTIENTTEKTEIDEKAILEGNDEIISYSLDTLKNIVCNFHQAGSFPQCRTCIQEKQKVIFCTQNYKQIQAINPATFWTVACKTPKIREKVKLNSNQNIEKLGKSVGLRCNQCYISASCPEFLPDSTCAIDFGLEIDHKDPLAVIEYIVKLQGERVGRAATIEVVDGGVPDQILSQEMDRFKNLALALKEIKNVSSSRTASITLKESATSNTVANSLNLNEAPKQGILAQLFGGVNLSKEPIKEIEYLEIGTKK